MVTANRVPLDDYTAWEDRFLENYTVLRGDKRYLAVRTAYDHGTFYLVLTGSFQHADGHTLYYPTPSEPVGTVYGPLLEGMAAEDIEGSPYVEWTGSAFRMSHCSPRTQVSFARHAKTFTYDQLTPLINRAKLTSNNEARAFMDLAEQSGDVAFRTVRTAYLGRYHRDPHQDHLRDIALDSIDTVWEAWKKNSARVADVTLLRAKVELLIRQLRINYTTDWRYERAEGWIQAGADPVSGNEWVYTLVAAKAAITDATKLPDPNWHFDALGAGINRNGQMYYDGQPEATDELPYRIRFYRPVPVDASAGASIGSVAWTQEEAY